LPRDLTLIISFTPKEPAMSIKTSLLRISELQGFNSVDWGKLSEKDIEAQDKTGRTLLHHAAREGLWHLIPNDLQNKKYWKTASDGETVYIAAFKGKTPDLLNLTDLTEEDILIKNNKGESVLSLACQHMRLKYIPQQLISKGVLEEVGTDTDRYIHEITRNDGIAIIPPMLLTEELLSLKGNYQDSSYHILARLGQLSLIPTELITEKAVLLKNELGTRVLEELAESEPHLIPKSLLNSDILCNEKENYPPLHRWAKGKAWAKIPKYLITHSTLQINAKGDDYSPKKKNLISILMKSYSYNIKRDQKHENKKESKDFIKYALSSLKTNDLIKLSKEEINLDEGLDPLFKNQFPSKLIKDEISKRDVVKLINKCAKTLEM